jgi:light-regulated signal transduction histidine kinase (bacteriophytochrome)
MNPTEISRQDLAHLRHQLRTPLNHIIGYSEILLEESTDNQAQGLLTQIQESAYHVLDAVQQDLAPVSGTITNAQMQALRERIQEPIQAVMRDVGLLVEQGGSSDLLDLLRVNSAASELLSFALGQSVKPPVDSSFQVVGEAEAATTLSAAVLLVDDNETNRDILGRQLERVGCTVTTADDGDSALRLIATGAFDLVLLDVIMPKLDGVATLQQIGKLRGETAPPVIMISALDEMDSVRRSLELGADDYLLKPFDPVLLRTRLAATLERSRLRAGARDRTRELEIALAQLQEVNEDLQQFAYAASHDLQSPIRTVMAMSQLLARRYKGALDENADELIENITAAMTRMSDLVQDLLAYSKLSGGEEELEQVLLSATVDVALANIDEPVRTTGARIEKGALPKVLGRRTHFVQLFQNLVGNAVKYRGPDPPLVRIAAEYTSTECVIRVEDNGMGFEPEYAKQIFEPFKRLHGHEHPGSGIGLAICARIVRQFGGRIWAESQPGKGSIFSFTVPVAICRQSHDCNDEERSVVR